MKPVVSHNRIDSLGPPPEEAVLLAVSREGRGVAYGHPSKRALFRLRSALLRTRLIDDIDVIQTTGCTKP
jgi:hypothetical protein